MPSDDSIFFSPQRIGDISWNFEKFLIGRDGKPYSRFHPSVIIKNTIKKDIDYLLSQSAL